MSSLSADADTEDTIVATASGVPPAGAFFFFLLAADAGVATASGVPPAGKPPPPPWVTCPRSTLSLSGLGPPPLPRSLWPPSLPPWSLWPPPPPAAALVRTIVAARAINERARVKL